MCIYMKLFVTHVYVLLLVIFDCVTSSHVISLFPYFVSWIAAAAK